VQFSPATLPAVSKCLGTDCCLFTSTFFNCCERVAGTAKKDSIYTLAAFFFWPLLKKNPDVSGSHPVVCTDVT